MEFFWWEEFVEIDTIIGFVAAANCVLIVGVDECCKFLADIMKIVWLIF